MQRLPADQLAIAADACARCVRLSRPRPPLARASPGPVFQRKDALGASLASGESRRRPIDADHLHPSRLQRHFPWPTPTARSLCKRLIEQGGQRLTGPHRVHLRSSTESRPSGTLPKSRPGKRAKDRFRRELGSGRRAEQLTGLGRRTAARCHLRSRLFGDLQRSDRLATCSWLADYLQLALLSLRPAALARPKQADRQPRQDSGQHALRLSATLPSDASPLPKRTWYALRWPKGTV